MFFKVSRGKVFYALGKELSVSMSVVTKCRACLNTSSMHHEVYIFYYISFAATSVHGKTVFQKVRLITVCHAGQLQTCRLNLLMSFKSAFRHMATCLVNVLPAVVNLKQRKVFLANGSVTLSYDDFL